VKKKLITVLNVNQTETKKLQNVIVQKDKLPLITNVSHVSTDVKNVLKVKLISVNLVLKEESMLQNVSVLKDIMMMVIMLNVKNVLQNVKHVSKLIFVKNVMTIETKNHMPVHVKQENMTVLQKDNVVNVTINVENVVKKQKNVILVLKEELTNHQNVHVHMVLPKFNKNVLIVMKKDVKLVKKKY